MSNKIIGFIKEHPYGVAAGVFGVGILWLLLRGGSSSASSGDSSAATIDSADAQATQAAEALQAQQLQANTQIASIQGQSADTATNDNASQNIAQIQANTTVSTTTLNDEVSQAIAALTAGVQTQNIAANEAVANNQTAAAVQTTQLNDQTLEDVALAPYEVELAQLADHPNASVTASIAQIIANQTTLQGDVNNIAQGPGGLGAINSELNGQGVGSASTPGIFGQTQITPATVPT